jgi:hypothetical protein
MKAILALLFTFAAAFTASAGWFDDLFGGNSGDEGPPPVMEPDYYPQPYPEPYPAPFPEPRRPPPRRPDPYRPSPYRPVTPPLEPTQAPPKTPKEGAQYKGMIEHTLLRGAQLGQPNSDCPQCASTAAGFEGADPSPECRKTYNDFFKIKPRKSQETQADSEIDVRISLGYMDDQLLGNDLVDDFYAAPLIRNQLISPCRIPGVSVCGFEQEPDDASVFRKRMELIGPDGQKRFRYVRVRIYRSSASSSDRGNNSPARRREQEEISESAREFFADSLKHSDMVLYIGHARDGGGPDFAPPKLRKKPPTTDLDWYRKYHPGTNLMYGALRETSTPPKMIGIFACYAKDHFFQGLRKVAPNTGLVLSGNNEFFSSVGQAVAMLDSVLGRRCEEELNAALEIPKGIKLFEDSSEIRVGPLKVDGVFAPGRR